MSRRTASNEVAILRCDAEGFEVVDVSEETYRWAQRECLHGNERRRIRKPFVATIEKSPNLCGPVLRIASDEREERAN